MFPYLAALFMNLPRHFFYFALALRPASLKPMDRAMPHGAFDE